MAAGDGTRLRPLTERWAKPILPIDGRPVLATLLRELARSGLGRATIVVGHLAEGVETLIRDGAWGIDVRCVRQESADGSADAVRRALEEGAEPPFLITAADTVYTAGDVARFAAALAESGAEGGIAVRRDPPPSPGKPPVRIRDGLVQRVVDDDPANPLGSAPLWALGPRLAPFFDDLPGPPFELRNVFQRAIDAGLPVAAVEIGPTRDLTDPLDLARENFPYLRAL